VLFLDLEEEVEVVVLVVVVVEVEVAAVEVVVLVVVVVVVVLAEEQVVEEVATAAVILAVEVVVAAAVVEVLEEGVALGVIRVEVVVEDMGAAVAADMVQRGLAPRITVAMVLFPEVMAKPVPVLVPVPELGILGPEVAMTWRQLGTGWLLVVMLAMAMQLVIVQLVQLVRTIMRRQRRLRELVTMQMQQQQLLMPAQLLVMTRQRMLRMQTPTAMDSTTNSSSSSAFNKVDLTCLCWVRNRCHNKESVSVDAVSILSVIQCFNSFCCERKAICIYSFSLVSEACAYFDYYKPGQLVI